MHRALLLGLGLMLLRLPPPGSSSPKGLPENFGELLLPRIEEKLQLDPDQKEQVAVLRREFKEKCLDVHNQTKAEADKIRAAAKKAGLEDDLSTKRKLNGPALRMLQAFKELKAEYEPRLRAVLTEEQKKQYDVLRKEKPQPAGAKGDDKKGPPTKNADKGKSP
jgi:hypothetical protein